MKSPYDYIVRHYGERYNNSVKVGDKTLITNSEFSDHRYINRVAEVMETPVYNPHPIKKGDKVILHHNVFRRMWTVKGKEVNARSFLNENEFIIRPDQVFMYGDTAAWTPIEGYAFIQPIKSRDMFSTEAEEPMKGIIRYIDGTATELVLKVDDLVGFQPYSDYEFVVDNVRMYRVCTEDITIKYGYKGDEEAYNPSWAESC